MIRAIEETKKPFDSSSQKTTEYLAWFRLFKREFTSFLKDKGVTEVDVHKPNHFDMTGFFKSANGQLFYFSISDLRWSKSEMMIRTAKSNKDYTGGRNQHASLMNVNDFNNDFDRIVGRSWVC